MFLDGATDDAILEKTWEVMVRRNPPDPNVEVVAGNSFLDRATENAMTDAGA